MAWQDTQASGTVIDFDEWNKHAKVVRHSGSEHSLWKNFYNAAGNKIATFDNDTYLYDNGTQMFKFDYNANLSYLRGGGTSSDGLYLLADSVSANPYIALTNQAAAGYITLCNKAGQGVYLVDGSQTYLRFSFSTPDTYIKATDVANGSIYLDSKNDIILRSGTTQMLKVRRASDDSKMYGGAGTTNDLYIYANQIDSYPQIEFIGSGALTLNIKSSIGSYVDIKDAGAQIFKFSGSGDDSWFAGGEDANDDLWIKANTSDSYPLIQLLGAGSIKLQSQDDILFYEQGTQMAKFLWNAGNSAWTGGGSAGNNLYIYANTQSEDLASESFIALLGQSDAVINAYSELVFEKQGEPFFRFGWTAGSPNYAYQYGGASTTDVLQIAANTIDDYPFIRLVGSGNIGLYAWNAVTLHQQTNNIFRFSGTSSISKMYGGDSSGDITHIYANTQDARPFIYLRGDNYITLYNTETNPIYFYHGANNTFRFSGSATQSVFTGGDGSTKDLKIRANSTDTYPQIILDGAGWISLENEGSHVYIKDQGNISFDFYESTHSYFKGQDTTGADLIIAANMADIYPTITLQGSANVLINTQFGDKIIFQAESNSIFQFSGGTTRSHMWGGSTAGDDLIINANSSDTYPYLELLGGTSVSIDIPNGGNFYLKEAGATIFNLSDTDGNHSWLVGRGDTGSYMTIKAAGDAYPYIRMQGASNIDMRVSSNNYVSIYSGTTEGIRLTPRGAGGYAYILGDADLHIGALNGAAYTFYNDNGTRSAVGTTGDFAFTNFYMRNGTDYYFYGSTDGSIATWKGGNATGDDLRIVANNVNARPYIHMSGNSHMILAAQGDIFLNPAAGEHVYINPGNEKGPVLGCVGATSYVYGGGATGTTLNLQGNISDTKPYFSLLGSGLTSLVCSDPGFIINTPLQGVTFSFSGNTGISKLFGGNVAGDDLLIRANSADAYPRIGLSGNSTISLHSNTDVIFTEQGNQMFKFLLVGTESIIKGGDATKDSLLFYSNTVDAYSQLQIVGSGAIILAPLNDIYFREKATNYLKFSYTAPDAFIDTQVSDSDLYLSSKNDIYFRSGTTQSFYFYHAGDDSFMYGGAGATDDLFIVANNNGTQSNIALYGQGNINIDSYADIIFAEQGTQMFKMIIDPSSKFYGGAGDGDDMVIFANSTNPYPAISLNGDAGMILAAKGGITMREQEYQIFNLQSGTAMLIPPGTKEPAKTGGTLWVSGSAATYTRLYYMSSNNGKWKQLSFD